MVNTRRRSFSPACSLPAGWSEPTASSTSLGKLQVDFCWLQEERDALKEEREALLKERDALLAERDAPTGDRDELAEGRHLGWTSSTPLSNTRSDSCIQCSCST
jgi:hypothetical protein|eukprot:7379472-Prymnesium_polylepis.1